MKIGATRTESAPERLSELPGEVRVFGRQKDMLCSCVCGPLFLTLRGGAKYRKVVFGGNKKFYKLKLRKKLKSGFRRDFENLLPSHQSE